MKDDNEMFQGCFRPGHIPDVDIACDKCGLVSYCSWACRATDDLHQYECEVMAEVGMVPVKDEVRIMVRAVSKLLQDSQARTDDRDLIFGGGDGDVVPTRNKLRRFCDLLSHKEDFLKSKRKTEDIKVNCRFIILFRVYRKSLIFTATIL